MKFVLLSLVMLLLTFFTRPALSQYNYPFTKKERVVDTYFGKRVTDNYRWMENMNDSSVRQWFKSQAVYADNILDKISGRDALLGEMLAIRNSKAATISEVIVKGNRYFYRKMQAGEAVSKIYCRQTLQGEEVLLVDPALFSTGNTGAVQYFVPSNDGATLAFGIAEKGSELATIYTMDVAGKKLYNEKIYPSWFGINGWTDDNKGFLYTLQQSGTTTANNMLLDSRVLYHLIGTDTATDKEIFSRHTSPQLKILPEDILFVNIEKGNPYMIATRSGVNRDMVSYIAPVADLLKPVINWQPLAAPADSVTDMVLHGNDLYLLSHKNASKYQVLVTNIRKPDIAHAATVVKEAGDRIESIHGCKNRLYIQYTDGINSSLQFLNFETREKREIKLPLPGTISINTLNKENSDLLLRVTSWKMPPVLYDYNATTGSCTKSIFHTDAVYPGAEDIVVKEIEVPGHDGVMIPLSVFYNKNIKLDGSAPCIMAGYGAYGSVTHPFFSPFLLTAVNKGMVAVWAHVRGGGEKGETWYKGGYKQTKPNTWKDFISCAEYLVRQKYTSPHKLTGWGTSAGGILIGRAVTERPDLFTAAINDVSISNALRFEVTPNGPNNTKEFGTVKNKQEAAALMEMDAVHHVKSFTNYPAVLTIAGMNDPRVIPWQPAKFAAAMQQSSISGKPALLKINYNSGHFTEDKLITYKNFADIIAFALWQSGDPRFQLSEGTETDAFSFDIFHD